MGMRGCQNRKTTHNSTNIVQSENRCRADVTIFTSAAAAAAAVPSFGYEYLGLQSCKVMQGECERTRMSPCKCACIPSEHANAFERLLLFFSSLRCRCPNSAFVYAMSRCSCVYFFVFHHHSIYIYISFVVWLPVCLLLFIFWANRKAYERHFCTKVNQWKICIAFTSTSNGINKRREAALDAFRHYLLCAEENWNVWRISTM